MKNKTIRLALLSTFFSSIFLSTSVQAQDEVDALRYSFLSPMGTARSVGFGSALGSVGGDFTSLSVNPAGIGVYRKSEFSMTPSLKINNVDASYLNQSEDDIHFRFNFNNIGFVATSPQGKGSYGWKTISFGIGLNRLADFNRNYNYSGTLDNNSQNYGSFSELFVLNANANPNNVDNEGTLGYLGYQSYLVNKDQTNTYFSLADAKNGLIQKKAIKERGGINELALSIGGNFEEFLMLGATLGIPYVSYTREMSFTEMDASNNPSNYFSSFTFKENLKTKGSGINLKLGAIIKPRDEFRFGVAIHTPTIMSLTDNQSLSLTTNTETFKSTLGISDTNPITSVSAPENSFNYMLRTPWRAVFSGTGFLGRNGFFSVDYEYLDYQSARYYFDQAYSTEESVRNQVIKNTYTGAHNVRLGLELKMDDFFVRGGYGIYGSPYKNTDIQFSRSDYSFGCGVRNNDMFIDIAWLYSNVKNDEKPYDISPQYLSPTARLNQQLNNMVVSIGWKF